MFSTDGFVIFRLIRRQPYSEMKRSGIEPGHCGVVGVATAESSGAWRGGGDVRFLMEKR